MRRRTVWIAVSVLVLSGIVGCRKSEEGTGGTEQTMAEQVKQQAGQAMETAADFAAEKKDQFVEAAQQKLDQLQQKYQQWKQQASVEGEQAQQKLSQLQADLEARLKAASESLGKAKEVGEDTWRETASAVQEALTHAQGALDQLMSYVKNQDQSEPATDQQ